jgi:hypothetical protein
MKGILVIGYTSLCPNCIFYKGIVDSCAKNKPPELMEFAGLFCPDFNENKNNPVIYRKWTEDEVLYEISRRRREDEAVKERYSDIDHLLQKLSTLPNRSSKTGRQIRKQLRDWGFYLRGRG